MGDKTLSSKGDQERSTPFDFVQQVCDRWPIAFDLAAKKKNAKHLAFFDKKDDSLKQDWSELYKKLEYNSKGHVQYLWLNPPFKNVTPWMRKCADDSHINGVRIVTLTLASRGTTWYHEEVKPFALSLILRRRLTFIGEKQPFTKELMLNIYDRGITGEGYLDWPHATGKGS